MNTPTFKTVMNTSNRRMWTSREAAALAIEAGFHFMSWNDKIFKIVNSERERSSVTNEDGTRTITMEPCVDLEDTGMVWKDLWYEGSLTPHFTGTVPRA